jgi:hypothetical protein
MAVGGHDRVGGAVIGRSGAELGARAVGLAGEGGLGRAAGVGGVEGAFGRGGDPAGRGLPGGGAAELAERVNPNGMVPGSEVTAGCADGPKMPSAKTSTLLVAFLVVTTNWAPSGVNPTWPGVPVNMVEELVPRPRSRVQDGTRIRYPPSWRKPAMDAPPQALRTKTWLPWKVMLTGNWPPELIT